MFYKQQIKGTPIILGGLIMQNLENLKQYLDKDEIIKWGGPSQPYSILDESNKKSTVKSWTLATLLAVLFNGGYYMLCLVQNMEFKALFLIFSVGIPLFVFMNPIFDKNNLKKQLYAITNKRVIVYTYGNDPQILLLDKVDAVRVEKASSGSFCHMRLGSATFKTPTEKLRSLAIKGVYDDVNNKKVHTGLIFYNLGLTDSEAVCSLLNPQTVITGRVA